MKIKIKKLSENAVIPHKHYDSDLCYDVTAVSCEEIAPNVYKYGLGIALQIERDKEFVLEEAFFNSPNIVEIKSFDFTKSPLKLSIDFRPRSSIWKTGMILSNCVGTIDEGYTNEISAIFYHVMPDMPKYEIGNKIGQIKIGVTFPIEFVEVEELNETDRGMNGYGSTGK